MSFIVLNCQVVEWVDIFANPVFTNPGIYEETKINACLHTRMQTRPAANQNARTILIIL